MTGVDQKPQRGAYMYVGKFELFVYGVVWCLCLGYSVYAVFLLSSEYHHELNSNLFKPGWTFTGRKKDVADFEWTFFSGWFWTVLPWFLGYTLFSQLIQWRLHQYRWVFRLGFSLLSLSCVMGWAPVALIAGHCVVAYLPTVTGSTPLVWLVCLSLLSTLNFQPFLSLMRLAVADDDDVEEESHFYLLLFTLAFSNLRYTSFCLERVAPSAGHVKQDGGKKKATGFFDILNYVFYLPLFYTGPLLTFDAFSEQIRQPAPPWNMKRFWAVVKQFIRIMFWACFCELSLHYFYFHSLQFNLSVMSTCPLWALAGIGYLHGQFFMVKYLVMFGFPTCLAIVDGMKTPEGPKCISRICDYSDMWKYFDRGFYSFIKRYMYIPLGGSRHGLLRQLAVVGLTFLYVFYWHGSYYYLFLWAAFNYLGIALEVLGHKVCQMDKVKAFETTWLGETMSCRLHALCTVPLFAMSALSIFVFFGGPETGMVYFNRLLIEGWPVSCVLIVVVLYCGVHVCGAVNRWEGHRAETKQD